MKRRTKSRRTKIREIVIPSSPYGYMVVMKPALDLNGLANYKANRRRESIEINAMIESAISTVKASEIKYKVLDWTPERSGGIQDIYRRARILVGDDTGLVLISLVAKDAIWKIFKIVNEKIAKT